MKVVFSKKTMGALFCALFLFFRTLPGEAAQIEARGAILMNLVSESVLYVQSEDRKVPPASLAKIMTMYVAMDAIKAGKASLSDRVTVSGRAASQWGSLMHVEKGDVVSLDLLLQGVAAASGNDASVAVAEYIAGSQQAFVKRMNDTARKLGMKRTSFRNPHGLPASGQMTTARDMLTLSKRYIQNHPEALPYHSILSVTHNGKTTTNKNRLLKTCPGVDGLKTGWIKASDFNLVTTAKRGDIRLIAVVLGAPTPDGMREESRRLIEAGFKTVDSGGRIKAKEWLAEDEER